MVEEGGGGGGRKAVGRTGRSWAELYGYIK